MKIADSRLGVCYFFGGGMVDDSVFRYFDFSNSRHFEFSIFRIFDISTIRFSVFRFFRFYFFPILSIV